MSKSKEIKEMSITDTLLGLVDEHIKDNEDIGLEACHVTSDLKTLKTEMLIAVELHSRSEHIKPEQD